ncbi:hypothetical protein SDJN03_00686, partial [Cucurbita argyrosperma subsp. sororia]
MSRVGWKYIEEGHVSPVFCRSYSVFQLDLWAGQWDLLLVGPMKNTKTAPFSRSGDFCEGWVSVFATCLCCLVFFFLGLPLSATPNGGVLSYRSLKPLRPLRISLVFVLRIG